MSRWVVVLALLHPLVSAHVSAAGYVNGGLVALAFSCACSPFSCIRPLGVLLVRWAQMLLLLLCFASWSWPGSIRHRYNVMILAYIREFLRAVT